MRITSGTTAPGPNDSPPDVDVVVVAALVWGEPVGKATLRISPATGGYITTQQFDVVLIVYGEGVRITGGRATIFSGGYFEMDVSEQLARCVVPGTLLSGGQTFRCPGIRFDDGTSLRVTLSLSDGSTVSDAVSWRIDRNSEP